MSALDSHKLYYEDLKPRKLITRKGGKDSKMSSKSTKVNEVKAPREYNKTRGEHFKDIVIAVLIVGVIAFIAGVQYAGSQNAKLTSAVKAAQVTAQTQTAKK